MGIIKTNPSELKRSRYTKRTLYHLSKDSGSIILGGQENQKSISLPPVTCERPNCLLNGAGRINLPLVPHLWPSLQGQVRQVGVSWRDLRQRSKNAMTLMNVSFVFVTHSVCSSCSFSRSILFTAHFRGLITEGRCVWPIFLPDATQPITGAFRPRCIVHAVLSSAPCCWWFIELGANEGDILKTDNSNRPESAIWFMSSNGSLLIQSCSCIWHKCQIKDEPVKKKLSNKFRTLIQQSSARWINNSLHSSTSAVDCGLFPDSASHLAQLLTKTCRRHHVKLVVFMLHWDRVDFHFFLQQ